MDISLTQKELENAVVIVSGLVDRSANTVAVAGNILIDASDQGVQFRGTDGQALVTVNVIATVAQPGLTTVPSDTFRDLVKLLPPNGEVRLVEKASRVQVHCESNDYKLMTLPATDFPQWPAEAGLTRFTLSQKVLKNLIDATLYALPNKDHRQALLGVHFDLRENELQLTATDGKKLARIKTPVPEIEGAPSASLVVPRKLLENVLRALGGEGPVELELSAKQIVFRFANIVYRGNGIDSKYPDCNAVIPKDFPTQIPLNRDIFIAAAKRAGVVSDEKNRSIILRLENNKCELQAMTYDLGAFDGSISMDYSGPLLELAFNFQFLIETLGRFTTPEVRMMIRSTTQPVVFKTDDEPDRLALLMPIKLADARAAAMASATHGDDEDDEEEADEE